MYSLACLFLTLWSLKGAQAIDNPTAQLYEHRGRNIKHDGSGTNFITLLGDTSNPKGTWPWVCSLGTHGLKDKSEWVHICTGVIASENHIITTVGCLEQFEWTVGNYDVVVRAGDRNIKVPYDDADVQTKYIASHEIHPDYKGPYNEADYEPYHDIAILTTNSSFNFTKYVRPIDLPEIRNGEVLRQNEIEEYLIFSDWAGPHRRLEPLLNSKFLLIEPPGVCQTLYPSLNVTHELMCAVDHLSLSRNCELDFGSPVIKEDGEINRYVLKGLLTMDIDEHEGCENSTNPNLIVSVASTRNLQFIYETMFNNPLSSMRQDEVIVIPVTIPEENNLSYENCGRNSILDDEPTLDNSQLAKYPWQVSLGLMTEPTDIKEWLHFCGGSILSPTKIITAAHCNLKLEKIRGTIQVRAGDDNLQNPRDNRGVQLREIKEYSSHPKYNRGTQYFDVGMITLKEPLNMTKYVRPICLPSLSEVKMLTKESEEGTPLTVTGWGSNDYGQVGEDLKAAIAVVLSEEKCNETHQLEYFNKNLVPDLFTSDLLCAEDPIGDAGTCDGDSGGPAVYFHHEKRKYFLRAIVSGSARRICGTKLFPNVYVRIADPFILEWILNQGWVLSKPQPQQWNKQWVPKEQRWDPLSRQEWNSQPGEPIDDQQQQQQQWPQGQQWQPQQKPEWHQEQQIWLPQQQWHPALQQQQQWIPPQQQYLPQDQQQWLPQDQHQQYFPQQTAGDHHHHQSGWPNVQGTPVDEDGNPLATWFDMNVNPVIMGVDAQGNHVPFFSDQL